MKQVKILVWPKNFAELGVTNVSVCVCVCVRVCVCVCVTNLPT